MFRYLRNQLVCMIKVPTIKLGGFSRHGGYLQANFLSLTSRLHGFVINLNVCNNADVQKLQ